MLVDKRLIRNIDIQLIVIVFVIAAIGLMVLYSATQPEMYPLTRVKKQISFLLMGCVIVFFMVSIDYRAFECLYYPMYLLSIILLVLVLVWGDSDFGAQRWLNIGGIGIQPSEIVKILIILTLAYSMSLREGKHSTLDVCIYLAHVAVPMALILKQPDLGTSFVLLAILLGMMFVAGVPVKYFVVLITLGIAVSPFLYNRFWKITRKGGFWILSIPTWTGLAQGTISFNQRLQLVPADYWERAILKGPRPSLAFFRPGIVISFFQFFVRNWVLSVPVL